MPPRESLDVVLDALKNEISDLEPGSALRRLAEIADPAADFLTQTRVSRLFDRLAPRLDLKPLRLAILGSCTLDHLAKVLPFYAALNGIALTVHVGAFDTMQQTVLDSQSDLYQFAPDIIWLFNTYRDVHLGSAPNASGSDIETLVAEAVDETAMLWRGLRQHSAATIIQNNADLPATQVYGNFEANVGWSRRNLLSRYNLQLTEALSSGVVIFDLDQAAACFGRLKWFDNALWNHSKHAFSLDAVGLLAFQFMRVVAGARGLAKKCLVLDLDNTLWGGVIGDDGLGGIKLGQGSADGEAFLHFQSYVADLQRRGIVLAVCSKNDETIARTPFEQHPDMRLALDDIAMFSANWHNKADNIAAIAATLDLGLDSLVFFDDNPAERALVRDALPMVTVPEVPEDPSLYVNCLDSLRLFETMTFSEEDGQRGRMYRQNAERKQVERQASNLDQYFSSLAMLGTVGELDALHRPRSSQLINKSNQFHLTTTRYSEAELDQFLRSDDWRGYYFKMADRFGDHGLVAVVLLRHQGDGDWLIDTWCMSCRVLARGMEEFTLNCLVDAAKGLGARRLIGHYRPTDKNRLVENLYPRLGFAEIDPADPDVTAWALDLTAEVGNRATFIERSGNAVNSLEQLNA